MEIQKILVPVDFSKASEKAVEFAIPLAKKFNAKIIFIHGLTVTYPPNAGAVVTTMPQPVPQDIVAKQKLSKEKLKDYLAGLPELRELEYTEMVTLGWPVDAINATAAEERVDLIVMGTEGAEGAEAFFLGTNSEKVSRKTACPVFVIPEDLKSFDMAMVGLALDTETIKKISTDVLEKLLLAFNSKLRVVHITDKGKTDFNKVKVLENHLSLLKKVEYSFHVFYDEDAGEGISNFLSKTPIDMLAIIYREHGFFERLFQPGLRKKLTFQTDIPLLVLK